MIRKNYNKTGGVKEGFSEEVAFTLRPEGSSKSDRESILGRRNCKYKGPETGKRLGNQRS